MVIRDISRQAQSVPEEHPNVKDHLRMMARAVNSLIKHQAVHPRDVPTTVSATYTMVDSDTLILCKADNPITVFLLTAAGREGKQVTIKKIDAGATPVIIDGKDAETIDGATTKTLSAQYSFISPKSDNTNWWSVAQVLDSGTYTDEQAQDAVGGILSDSGDIDFTYDDVTPAISAIVKTGVITETKISLTDTTTHNVSSSKHGFAPKGDGSTTTFLNGNGAYSTPSGTGGSGSVYPAFTAPVNGDFAWINQGGASVTVNANGGIFLRAPGSSGDSLRIRKKSAPSTPYTITTALLANNPNLNTRQAGLCWRQSSDGKLVAYNVLWSSTFAGNQIECGDWNSPTSFSALNGTAFDFMIAGIVWLQLRDDGTNRTVAYSWDGYNFEDHVTEGRTTFMTADEVGFFCGSNTTATAAGVTLLSWAQT